MEDKEYRIIEVSEIEDVLTNLESLQKYFDELENELKEIKNYIHNKIQKSFEYDMGISDKCDDRLFTETVIELQIIESMIDKILEEEEENNG